MITAGSDRGVSHWFREDVLFTVRMAPKWGDKEAYCSEDNCEAPFVSPMAG